MLFRREDLEAFTKDVFMTCNVPEQDAITAASVLGLADVRGIDSHGIARLHTYVGLLREGAINPQPKPGIAVESDATATIDGDNGMGLVVGPIANRVAIEKASSFGTGWVAVRNTNHFGIAGYYVLESLAHDLIGIAMSNSTAIVAPLWGSERRLGTNPLAVAFPGKQEGPVVIDMATSTVALGKIEVANRKNASIPSVWAMDKSGNATRSPLDVLRGGSIQPLGHGRQTGGHKGYCLSALVDVLSGVLPGAAWGPYTPPFEAGRSRPSRDVGDGIGHFFGAMTIGGFAEPEDFMQEVDMWVKTFRATAPVNPDYPVIIPGDPESAHKSRREAFGIPLSNALMKQMLAVAEQAGVAIPEPIQS